MPRSITDSPSEGEIVDTDSEKATTSIEIKRDTNVDPAFRHRGTSSRSPSPYRAPKPNQAISGIQDDLRDSYSSSRSRKRPYEAHYDRQNDDSRRFKIRYEALPPRESAVRAPTAYDATKKYQRPSDGRHPLHGSQSSKDRFRNGVRERRSFLRSTSPPLLDNITLHAAPSEVALTNTGTGKVSNARHVRHTKVSPDERAPLDAANTEKNIGDPIPDADAEFGLDEVALIAARRKRREAIKARHQVILQTESKHEHLDTSGANHAQTALSDSDMLPRHLNPSLDPDPESHKTPLGKGTQAALREEQQIDEDDSLLATLTDKKIADSSKGLHNTVQADEASAADYDPTMDMQEDKIRHDRQFMPTSCAQAQIPMSVNGSKEAANTKTSDPEHKTDELDMFGDNALDMFADDTNSCKIAPQAPGAENLAPKTTTIDTGMIDDWDDHEGYYKVNLGELLEQRYLVQSNLGKGMFSSVVRATDQETMRLVAIKVIRNNEIMRKAGMKEIDILDRINAADPEDRRHVVRLERSFEHKGHLCMVFENLSINLREVLKKFGRDIGINLEAVRVYAYQMFLGLSLLRKCNILHADLKPDNVLINDSRSLLKICDLGSASDASDNEITQYLVSRFYRAPEIILGLPYDFAIDMWSVGCTLYELYTGKILFTGRSNNQMLRAIMECRGKISHKMLRRTSFLDIHFDNMLNFRSIEKDRITGKDTVRIMNLARPTRDLRTRLMATSKNMSDSELRNLHSFIDLLERCLNLTPEKRCTPAEALKHPFITR